MPYIAQKDRIKFEVMEDYALKVCPIETAGELQYMIALAITSYFKNNDYRYQNMNDVMGALTGAQAEFYRRHVAPYEDSCIDRNGDVANYHPLKIGVQ